LGKSQHVCAVTGSATQLRHLETDGHSRPAVRFPAVRGLKAPRPGMESETVRNPSGRSGNLLSWCATRGGRDHVARPGIRSDVADDVVSDQHVYRFIGCALAHLAFLGELHDLRPGESL
jgi:hypothetical protein